MKNRVIIIKNRLRRLLRIGGLKLKLISFVFIAIVVAISAQNLFIIPHMESYIEKKAFEVSETTIERISDFSAFALLERTYENRLSLSDAIKKIQGSEIDGLLGVSIYQRQKDDQDIKFTHIAGFGDDVLGIQLDSSLIKSLNNSSDDKLSYDSYTIYTKGKMIDTYRFIRPITYVYQNKTVLLGVSVLYYDKNAINDVVKAVVDFMFSVTTVILLFATLFVYFIGVRFTRPILEITKAASTIAKGDLDITLNIKTNDEIEHLAYHFNLMVDGLKEKDKMQKFVSGSTMNMIKSKENKNIILGGEYRVLTFLFSDIRGFTAMSEQMNPSDVISVVNFYLNLQAIIIFDNGGDIDKYIGDEIMASFTGDDATRRAIKCSVEIQKMIKNQNTIRENLGITICEVGIGINRGEVIVGNIGSNEHMDFTAVGSVVNVASRLCSSANAGEVIIGKDIYDKSGSNYGVDLNEPLTLKGIKSSVETYSLRITGALR